MSSSPSFLDPIVIKLIRGESVLDVGCGYGRWGNLIRTNYWEAGYTAPPPVDGIDAFPPNVDLCTRQPAYRRAWQHILPTPIDGQWDTVLACEIIEHLPEADVDRAIAVLEAAARRRVIISTPNWPDFRPGHDTLVGHNDYEAHRCYVSRDELKRRGYTVIGAGFGNPTLELAGAIARFDAGLLDVLQSLSRAFPEVAYSIVAYKDMDASGPADAVRLAGPSLHDLRIATVNGRVLAYDSGWRKLVPVPAVDATTAVMVMRDAASAFAITADHGLLTFTPNEAVHGGTRAVSLWEILGVGERVTAFQGSPLQRFCHPPDAGEISLIAPPLQIAAQPWFADLLQRVAAFSAEPSRA